MVEGRLSQRQRAKQSIEDEESDAKVLVHEAAIIQNAMMDFMQPASRKKPELQHSISFQPEPFDVHDIVEIAEHEKAPPQSDSQPDRLIEQVNMKAAKRYDSDREYKRGGSEPFKSDVPECEPFTCGVVIFGCTLFPNRAVVYHVMFHVAPTEKSDPTAVHQAVQPVTEDLRRDARPDAPGRDH